MADAEKRGQEYLAQARKKIRSVNGCLGGCMESYGKFDDAIGLFVKAANSFKMARNWEAAGEAFCEAAKYNLKQNVKHEAASNYNDAATCFRKTDIKAAVSCLSEAIEIHVESGRFSSAAKQHLAIAEMYEAELKEKGKTVENSQEEFIEVIEHYERAAEFYLGEDSSSHANKCLLKVAEISALLEKYPKSIEIYEKVAKNSSGNNLLKFTVRDHLFRAVVCRMCQDNEDAKISLEKYERTFPLFADSRENRLLRRLTTAVEESNAEDYTAALQEWDAMTRLDAWFVTLFNRIRKQYLGDQNGLAGLK